MSVEIVITCNKCGDPLNPEDSIRCGKCSDNMIYQIEIQRQKLNGAMKEINRLKSIDNLEMTQDIRDIAVLAESFLGNITRCPICHRPQADAKTFNCVLCKNPDEEPLTVELEYTEEE